MRRFLLACITGYACARPGSFQQSPRQSIFNVTDFLSYEPDAHAGKTYDYIVAGGGLTGLTTAVTLSKNPDISVLVIESGFYASELDPLVTDLNSYGDAFFTSLDHAFAAQATAKNNATEIIHSGRGLGGSTLINGGTWTRPHKAQVDAWAAVFGNDGWTWDQLLPYMMQAENVRMPSQRQLDAGHAFDETCHGSEGPVHAGPRDTSVPYSPLVRALMSTARAYGAPIQKDLSCGDPHGVSMFPNSLHADQQRSDTSREWLLPAIGRKNLKILVGQSVGKVLFDQSTAIPRAIGVEFGTHDSLTHQAFAKHEVLIAAGSSVSPLILEYSGVGLKTVLDEAGVRQIVDLPVGLNQQDQTTTHLLSKAEDAANGQGQAAFFASLNETFGTDIDRALELLQDDRVLERWADEVIASGAFHDKTALMLQYRTQVNHLINENVAFTELFLDTDGAISFDVWNLLPFSRGYIHIDSANPYLHRTNNNPRFMENEFDVLGQAAAVRLARQMATTGDMAHYFNGEIVPGFEVVRQNATLDEWAKYVRSHFRANYHAVATCSMMARELGGVVDASARVYGTQGLRVIDGSIPPAQVSSHVMTVFYGMALKISEEILHDYERST